MEESLAIATSHPFFPGSGFASEVVSFPESYCFCILEVGGLKLPKTGFLGGGGGMTLQHLRSSKLKNYKISETFEV